VVRAVLFDVGGVLEVNPSTRWPERWAARLRLTEAVLHGRVESATAGGDTGAVTLADVERRVAAALNLDGGEVAELMDDLWTEYVGSLNRRLAAFARSLRPRFKTGILSNSFVGAREREQSAHDFESMFDAIVYSHEVGLLKPDPAIYTIACDRLGVEPRDVLFVDDLRANCDGARAAGMDAIQFVGTERTIAEIAGRLGGPAAG